MQVIHVPHPIDIAAVKQGEQLAGHRVLLGSILYIAGQKEIAENGCYIMGETALERIEVKPMRSEEEFSSLTSLKTPLLSDAEIDLLVDHGDGEPEWVYSRREIRDFYENLITSGKLRVVEEEVTASTRTVLSRDADVPDALFEFTCSDCEGRWYNTEHYQTHCPDCGHPIKHQ